MYQHSLVPAIEKLETIKKRCVNSLSIKKGKTNPGFNFLVRLYRKYKVSLDWLLFKEGEMFCGISIKEFPL